MRGETGEGHPPRGPKQDCLQAALTAALGAAEGTPPSQTVTSDSQQNILGASWGSKGCNPFLAEN